jgi:multidrug transporter EmrE-like cation transporter
MANTQRYWDGSSWTNNVAPLASTFDHSDKSKKQQSQVMAAAIVAASALGIVLSLQSASLLTGTGTLWTGVAIAWAASAGSYVVRQSLPKWVRFVAIVSALAALVNVIYVEQQLEERRQEINRDLESPFD